MSLFKSLFPLARDNSLTVLIVAEGEQLRVNVMPKSTDEKASKTLYPLSLLGSPDELDRDFAEAVQIYSPGSQSVLEQAHAASAANGAGKAAPALPAPGAAPAKGKPGRKPRAAALPAPETPTTDATPSAERASDAESQVVDSRQTSIPGLEADNERDGEGQGESSPAAQSSNGAETSENADDGAVDLL